MNQIALKLEIETLCVAQFWMNQINVNRCGRISIYLKTWNIMNVLRKFWWIRIKWKILRGGLKSTKTWNYNGCVKKNVQTLILSFCLSLNFIKDTRYRIVYIAI